MFWNTWLDRRVTLSDASSDRDADTGIIRGAEPMSLGPEDQDRAILMVHGFSGSPNNFNDLPGHLAEAGWHVHVMLLPGHGTTPREFEATTAEKLEQAVTDELALLRGRFATVVLLGHSMGGALATLAAARNRVEGLILVSPYYAVTHRWYYLLHPETWARLLSPVVRWIYSSPQMQPVNRAEVREQIISYHWIPVRSALTAMELAARARDAETTACVDMPVLLIHSRMDQVTDSRVAESVFNAFPAKEKQAAWLHRSDHIVFWDYEREEVKRQVDSFLHGLLEHHKR